MNLFVIFSMLRKDTKNFKDSYKIARTFAVSMDDLLKTMKKKIGENTQFLNNHLDKIIGINVKLQAIAENQIDSINNFNDILSYQNNITKFLVSFSNETYLNNQKKRSAIKKRSKLNQSSIIHSKFIKKSTFSLPEVNTPNQKTSQIICVVHPPEDKQITKKSGSSLKLSFKPSKFLQSSLRHLDKSFSSNNRSTLSKGEDLQKHVTIKEKNENNE